MVEILRHPRTPWYVKAAAIAVVAYAASPIDLIPDFIPILGYLDDLLLLPLGICLVVRLTPADVRRDAFRRALRAGSLPGSPSRWVAAGIVFAVWAALITTIVLSVVR